MNSLSNMLVRASRLNPNGTAMIYSGCDYTWTALQARISRLAAGLQKLGLEPEERIGILSLNSHRFFESVFGISWMGCALVPMNTRWALAENTYAAKDSGLRVLIFGDTFIDQAQQLLAEVDSLQHIIYAGDGECPDGAVHYESLIEEHGAIAPSQRGGSDMAGIFYTGGTTGFPKGVMLSHDAIWSSAIGALPSFNMSRNSIYLHAAPMFHVADFAGSMNTTLCCATHVILPSFDPAQVLSTFAAQRITHVLMVPSMIKMLLNHPDAGSADVSSLETIIYGASPMPLAVLEQCLATWPTVGLVQAYGQTELAPVATTLPMRDHVKGSAKLKAAGIPTAVTDMRIVDSSGADCTAGKTGEIAVHGPHTMLGYWNKPEETASTLQNGWVFTGDAGYLDEEGYLFIVDRVKDMVVSGGENVFTTEVENAIISHGAVRDVAVIGIPHEEWGEAVHAIVVLHEGARVEEKDILEHCRSRIAGYKLPKGITIRDEPLPLSGAGKVLKTELRKPYWAGQDRQVN